jgi:hypothetical protein
MLEDRLRDAEKWNDMPFSLEPNLPNPAVLKHQPFKWIWDNIPKISLIGAGVGMAWYTATMRGIADAISNGTLDNYQPDYNLASLSAVTQMWFW